MKITLKKLIGMAEAGYTRAQIIKKLGITEKEYKHIISGFSRNSIEKLRRLLIGNALRKKNGNDETSNHKTNVETFDEVTNLYDTSYIISGICEFQKLEGIILPEVFEQLIFQEKVKKNKRAVKFFHVLLESTNKIKLEKCKYSSPTKVPEYEDVADFALLDYAMSHNKCKIYTCDKILAARCIQNGIEFQFENIDEEDKVTKNLTDEVPEVEIVKIGKRERGVKLKDKQLVYDKLFRIVQPNNRGVIPVKEGCMILTGNKFFKFDQNYNLEEIKKNRT